MQSRVDLTIEHRFYKFTHGLPAISSGMNNTVLDGFVYGDFECDVIVIFSHIHSQLNGVSDLGHQTKKHQSFNYHGSIAEASICCPKRSGKTT